VARCDGLFIPAKHSSKDTVFPLSDSKSGRIFRTQKAITTNALEHHEKWQNAQNVPLFDNTSKLFQTRQTLSPGEPKQHTISRNQRESMKRHDEYPISTGKKTRINTTGLLQWVIRNGN
jgi:hypothetical protein